MVNNTSLKPFPAVQMFKTHYIKGTLNPEWNYPSPLDWGSILSQKCYLYLIVYLFLSSVLIMIMIKMIYYV